MRKSKNEKVAEQIAELVNDVTLDLDQIGEYLAQERNVTYRRIVEIIDSAETMKEKQNGNRIRS